MGNLIAGTLDWQTVYQYDGLDRLMRVDQKGASAVQANWRTRTFAYDSLSRLTHQTFWGRFETRGRKPGDQTERWNVLLTNQRYDDALAALKAASRVAKTPEDIATVQSRIAQVAQYQASVAQGQQAQIQPGTASVTTVVTDTRTTTIHQQRRPQISSQAKQP